MLKRNQNGASVYKVTDYSMPKLHTGKKWFIDFMCFDVAEGRLRRKKYHLDNISKVSDRRKRAAELISLLTAKLRNGWNVWSEEAENARHYTLYNNVCEYYINYLNKMGKSGAIKKSTLARNLSYFSVFNGWIEKVYPFPLVYIYQFNIELVGDFLDYMLLDRDVSPVTRNNYRNWLVTFCGWMVDKGYLSVNPAEKIKTIPEEPKKRDQLSPADLRSLRAYLDTHNGHFLLACMMEYYTLIRPEELTNVRLCDISIKDQKISVSGEYSKNRKDGAVGLNGAIIKQMLELDIFAYDVHCYLFGTKDFRPGPVKQSGRIFRNYFLKVRRALKWPDNYQFYSLKDTGIRDLANAEGIVVARDQARHSDVSTTNKYLKGSALTVHEETKHFKGGL